MGIKMLLQRTEEVYIIIMQVQISQIVHFIKMELQLFIRKLLVVRYITIIQVRIY